MKRVVITGSSRGIGRGLAREFLRGGHRVVVSGSGAQSTERAVAALGEEFGPDRVAGVPCDVTDADQVQVLWYQAFAILGGIDIWINNAGVTAPAKPFWEVDLGSIQQAVDINLRGTLNGCHVAMRGMRTQGGGHIYNMEGFGSDDRKQRGLATYGSTKRAVRYLNQALAKEAKDGPVKVCALSPGIVITDFILGQARHSESAERWEQSKGIFNIIGDRVETVTPWLVEQMLREPANGKLIAWMTGPKLLYRFLASRIGKGRDLFDGVDADFKGREAPQRQAAAQAARA